MAKKKKKKSKAVKSEAGGITRDLGAVVTPKDEKPRSLSEILSEAANLQDKYLGVAPAGSVSSAPSESMAASESMWKTLAEKTQERPEETQAQLDLLKQQQATAGQRSQSMADILAQYQAGLGGYTAEEANALREQMLGQIGTGEKTALRQLRGVQAASGVRGGLAAAQAADVLKQSQKARAEGERNIFLQNMDEKQRRLEAYRQAQAGAEDTEFNRGTTAQQLYGNTLTGAQQQEYNQQTGALSGLGSQALSNADWQRQAEKYNIEQQQTKADKETQAKLGLAGLSMGQESEQSQLDFLKEQAAKQDKTDELQNKLDKLNKKYKKAKKKNKKPSQPTVIVESNNAPVEQRPRYWNDNSNF